MSRTDHYRDWLIFMEGAAGATGDCFREWATKALDGEPPPKFEAKESVRATVRRLAQKHAATMERFRNEGSE